jgi:hypothetical protein
MTSRVTLPSQDFQRMCKQAERDHESRKLVVLIERVKRQIAERENSEQGVDSPKPPATAISEASRVLRLPSRLAPFER